ncbi:MAG: MFS transporter [Chloroflexi bacterium]|nr:MAG: MFS transporter [Chloroflexota bacterium]
MAGAAELPMVHLPSCVGATVAQSGAACSGSCRLACTDVQSRGTNGQRVLFRSSSRITAGHGPRDPEASSAGALPMSDRVTDANAKWFTLAAACVALFMAILDNLVVNVALPTISRDLEASTTQLQWIVSAYILVFASLQITAGGLGDRLGRKRWFMIGTVVFIVASLFATFARNVEMLIAARALQGLGAAFIMPLSLSLVSAAFPPEERGKATGIWSAISVSGLALGPVVGGLLVQYVSWHWIFLINVPIGIAALIGTSKYVRESRDTSGEMATDIPGTLLITGAIAALTWGLIEAGTRGWTDNLILASFGLAAALTAAFLFAESRVEKPMVPLRFFRSRTFVGANIDSFSISFLIAGIAFFGTLYLQNVLGFSPVRAGMALIPTVCVMMIGAPISGILINRVGSRLLISLGMVIAGIGTLLYMRASPDGRYLDLLPSYLVTGLGMSLIFAPMTTAVLNSVESSRAGVASAVNGAIREIGNAFGIALLGTLMNRAYQAHFNAAPQVQQLRSDSSLGPLQPVVDIIGSGMSFGGRVVEDAAVFPGLAQFPEVVATLRQVSSEAFMAGMDRAIYVATGWIVVAAVISYMLIKDSVVSGQEQVRTERFVQAETVGIADD